MSATRAVLWIIAGVLIAAGLTAGIALLLQHGAAFPVVLAGVVILLAAAGFLVARRERRNLAAGEGEPDRQDP